MTDRVTEDGDSLPLGSVTWDALVDRLADALVVADRDGVITYWNAAAERIFGWPAEVAVGQTLDLIIPERYRARHWAGYDHAIQTGTTAYGDRRLEVPALHREGRPLSIAFTLTLLPDAEGRISRLAALVRDDTERWQESRRLRHEVDELRAAAGEHAPSGRTNPA